MSERKKRWAVKIDDDYFYSPPWCQTKRDAIIFRDDLHDYCGYKRGKVVRVIVSIQEVKPTRSPSRVEEPA